MKKVILVGIMFMMFMGVVSASSKNGDYKGNPIVKIINYGVTIEPDDVPAVIYNGRTMIPISMLKKLGADVLWNQEKYSVSVEFPKIQTAPTPVPTQQPPQIDTISDFKYYTSAVMDNLNKAGIILNTYSLNVDKDGLFAYAQYQPDVSSSFAYSNGIATIASVVAALNYPIDGTIIELVVGTVTTGTVGIGVSDAKDYVNKKITLSEFVGKWKNTINDTLSNRAAPPPSSTPTQNAAMCRIINSNYDDEKRQKEESMGARGMGRSSDLTNALNKIESDRNNELELYGCPTK